MPTIAFFPVNETAEVDEGTNLLEMMLARSYRVRSVCKGRGICATCHVKVRGNAEALSPRTVQERKTLAVIENSDATSRLACQSNVMACGATIDLPEGVYVESMEDLLDLVGDRAVTDYLHPVTGSVLIPKAKIITRSLLVLFKNLSREIQTVTA